jgi:hypothetical protein
MDEPRPLLLPLFRNPCGRGSALPGLPSTSRSQKPNFGWRSEHTSSLKSPVPVYPHKLLKRAFERCTASTDSPAVGQRSAGDRRQNPHQALDDSCRWWTTRWRRASHVTAAARPGAAAHFERRKMQSSDWRLLTVALSFRGAVRIAVHCEQSSLALASGSQDASRLRGACLRCPRASRIRPAAQWGIRAAPGESSLRTAPSSGGQSRFHNENNIRAISMIRANCPHQMGF